MSMECAAWCMQLIMYIACLKIPKKLDLQSSQEKNYNVEW